MMAASLIGFALAFLLTSVSISLVLGGVLQLTKRLLQASGPWAERRAAALVLVLPPVLAAGLTAILAGNSTVALVLDTDHCLDDANHLHLCLEHGTLWSSQVWAVATLGFVATFVLVRLAQTVWAHTHAQLAVTRLQRAGRPLDEAGRSFLVPSDDKIAFAAGVFSPAVIVSTAAWALLDESQRIALLAHERAHIVHGDLWWRALLGLLSCFGAPVLASGALATWKLACERVCDLDAACEVGKPSIVASAILSLARSPGPPLAPPAAVFAAACNVTERIHTLLDEGPDGAAAAKTLTKTLLLACFAAAALSARFAESLHHFLETILG